MTTYTTIPDTDIDQDSPVTQPLMTALRDNAIAIAENDASVPDALRAHVPLGTIATTSGTLVTLSGIDFGNCTHMLAVFDGVDLSSTVSRGIKFAGSAAALVTSNTGSAKNICGFVRVDLATSVGMSHLSDLSGGDPGVAGSNIFTSTLTTASTSVSVEIISPAGVVFDGGQIAVYGVK